mgnify:CR=1 FL=1
MATYTDRQDTIRCPMCRGKGIQSLHGAAITGAEMEELGEDFQEDYVAGVYDHSCDHCGGTGGDHRCRVGHAPRSRSRKTDGRMSGHSHRNADIVGYRVVETRTDAGNHGSTIVEFFDGWYYSNAIDVARQIASDTRRGFAIVDRHYECGCWSVTRNPGETSILAVLP